MRKEFNSEPAYNTKYLQTKIKSYKEKIVHNNKIPKEGSQCIFLTVILIDSVYINTIILKLEEFKYVVKGKKMSKFITDDIEISSDDSKK